MSQRSAFAITACALLVLLIPQSVVAQSGIPTVLLTGKVVGDLIEQFEDASNRLLQNAGNTGDALASKFGNELNVATRNVDILLSRQRTLLFDDLDREQQALFIEMNRIIDTANQSVGQAATMAEIANLNLIEFTNRLPFTENVDFYLSSVQGLTQPHSDGNYHVLLRGLGIGFSPAGRQYRVRVAIAGQELPSTSLRAVSATDLELTIPHNILAPHFSDTTLNQVPLVVSSTITKRQRRIFRDRVTEATYTVPLAILLLPRLPGVVSGIQSVRTTVVNPEIHKKAVTVQSPSCTTRRPCDWSREISLADNEEFVGVDYACTGPCGWSYNLRSGGYAIDYDILEGGRKIVFYRHIDAGGTTVTHYVLYRRRESGSETVPIPPLRLAYGRETTFETDPRNTNCNFALHGQLVTGQRPYLDSGMVRSVDGTLSKVSVAQLADRCRITLLLNLP